MTWLVDPNAWVALVTLTLMEIVLGVDNIIFITLLTNNLPESHRDQARTLGLLLAMMTRILLLLSVTWIMHLKTSLFSFLGHPFSGRDLILMLGGVFLLAKSTQELHNASDDSVKKSVQSKSSYFLLTLIQIALIDIIFSVDSVITAVGMADDVEVMIIAIVIAVMVMLFSAKAIASFIEQYPTLKILALSFLLLIGVTLIAEGLRFHIPKGYIYFAMAFSVAVECLNIRKRKKVESKNRECV